MYTCTYISFDLFRCLVCPYRYGTSFEGRAERKRWQQRHARVLVDSRTGGTAWCTPASSSVKCLDKELTARINFCNYAYNYIFRTVSSSRLRKPTVTVYSAAAAAVGASALAPGTRPLATTPPAVPWTPSVSVHDTHMEKETRQPPTFIGGTCNVP